MRFRWIFFVRVWWKGSTLSICSKKGASEQDLGQGRAGFVVIGIKKDMALDHVVGILHRQEVGRYEGFSGCIFRASPHYHYQLSCIIAVYAGHFGNHTLGATRHSVSILIYIIHPSLRVVIYLLLTLLYIYSLIRPLS
jgi:hypothetical protein